MEPNSRKDAKEAERATDQLPKTKEVSLLHAKLNALYDIHRNIKRKANHENREGGPRLRYRLRRFNAKEASPINGPVNALEHSNQENGNDAEKRKATGSSSPDLFYIVFS